MPRSLYQLPLAPPPPELPPPKPPKPPPPPPPKPPPELPRELLPDKKIFRIKNRTLNTPPHPPIAPEIPRMTRSTTTTAPIRPVGSDLEGGARVAGLGVPGALLRRSLSGNDSGLTVTPASPAMVSAMRQVSNCMVPL